MSVLNSPSTDADLAQGKPATQSSVSTWSIGGVEDDAARVVSADFSSDYSHHTTEEPDPWWQVDLGEDCAVREIRINNRPGFIGRFGRYRVEIGTLSTAWTTIMDSVPPSVPDEDLYVWTASEPTTARFLRITALGDTCLHLSRVQVFGTPAGALPAPVAEPVPPAPADPKGNWLRRSLFRNRRNNA